MDRLIACVCWFASVSLAVGLARAGSPDLASLDVPLTISEVAGVDRKQDVWSTGVPLPCGLHRESAGIAVFGPPGKPVPAQFRVLERWREKGDSVKRRLVRANQVYAAEETCEIR